VLVVELVAVGDGELVVVEELVVVGDGELVVVEELVVVGDGELVVVEVDVAWGEGQGRDRDRAETVFAPSVEPRCPMKGGCHVMIKDALNAKAIWLKNRRVKE
jgi:hypothetical protein